MRTTPLRNNLSWPPELHQAYGRVGPSSDQGLQRIRYAFAYSAAVYKRVLRMNQLRERGARWWSERAAGACPLLTTVCTVRQTHLPQATVRHALCGLPRRLLAEIIYRFKTRTCQKVPSPSQNRITAARTKVQKFLHVSLTSSATVSP